MSSAWPTRIRTAPGPFGREQYIQKFLTLTDGIISTRESNRFLEVVQDLASCRPASCIC